MPKAKKAPAPLGKLLMDFFHLQHEYEEAWAHVSEHLHNMGQRDGFSYDERVRSMQNLGKAFEREAKQIARRVNELERRVSALEHKRR